MRRKLSPEKFLKNFLEISGVENLGRVKGYGTVRYGTMGKERMEFFPYNIVPSCLVRQSAS